MPPALDAVPLTGVGNIAREVRNISVEAQARENGTQLLGVSSIFAPLPAVPWLCQALDAAPGAPVLVAGYGFTGKTLAIQDLALAVASGSPAWGRFPVRRGRVLHLDYEQGSHLTRQRYQRLARGRGIDSAALEDRLVLAPMPAWYLDNDGEDELARLADAFELVVVDSFRAGAPHTDENVSDARIPLDRLTRISEATGCTTVVVHHARKPTQNAQGGARMTVRGSGALYDACGSVLVFTGEKGEPVSVAHEKARITGRTHADFRLRIEDVEIDGDPVAGLRVSVLEAPTAVAAPSSANRFANLKQRVLEFVRDAGMVAGGASSLRARLGCRKEDILAAVAELEAEGLVTRGGHHTRPTLTYTGTHAPAE